MRKALLVCFALIVIFGASLPVKADLCSTTANLVTNCGFETGNFRGWSTYPPGYDGVWYGVSSADAYSGSYGAYVAGFGSFATRDGNYALLYQPLATTPGVSYVLTFDLAHIVPDVPPPTPDNVIFIGAGSTLLAEEVNAGNQDWTSLRYLFTAASPSTPLIFQAEDANYFFSIDNVAVTQNVLPEPATWLLALPALAGLYLMRRRRRAAA
jgi:hypothetical protein